LVWLKQELKESNKYSIHFNGLFAGRNKRDVTNIEFIVGSEDCKNVSPDGFCNGPLQPGTSYKYWTKFITVSTGRIFQKIFMLRCL
jgi:hypothetical protein